MLPYMAYMDPMGILNFKYVSKFTKGMEVSIVMGVPPIAGWFIRENHNLKRMMTGGTPMAMETPIWRFSKRHRGTPSHHPFELAFPSQKLTFFGGTPMAMEPSI